MFQDKAQTAENGWQSVELGMIYCGKTEFGHLGASLRASWEAVVRGVAPLGKDRAITCEARLAVNHFPTR
jgi:hypothetical protein